MLPHRHLPFLFTIAICWVLECLISDTIDIVIWLLSHWSELESRQHLQAHLTKLGIWLQLSSEASGLRRRRSGLLPSGPKSSFQMRASFVIHLETKVLDSKTLGPRVWRKGGEAHCPSCLKSSVTFPQSVMIWGAMSSAGVGPLCFLKINITAPVYQDIL